MYRPHPDKNPTKTEKMKKENCEIPKPSFATDCNNDPVSKKIPKRPDEPISLEELTRAKSDIRGTCYFRYDYF